MITARRHIRGMNVGYTNSQLMEGEDGNEYVVKFMSNPLGIKVLFNELVSYRLGKLFRLPIPKGRIIHVPNKVIKEMPSLGKLKVEEGPHFGSLYIQNTRHMLGPMVPSIRNLHLLPSLIVFDHWITNYDRWMNNQNWLVRDDRNLIFIDHANAFDGPKWTDDTLRRNRNCSDRIWGHVYEQCMPYVDRKHLFDGAFLRLRAVKEKHIRHAIRDIPEEWGMSEETLELFVEHLMERKPYVEQTIRDLKEFFPLWKMS